MISIEKACLEFWGDRKPDWRSKCLQPARRFIYFGVSILDSLLVRKWICINMHVL